MVQGRSPASAQSHACAVLTTRHHMSHFVLLAFPHSQSPVPPTPFGDAAQLDPSVGGHLDLHHLCTLLLVTDRHTNGIKRHKPARRRHQCYFMVRCIRPTTTGAQCCAHLVSICCIVQVSASPRGAKLAAAIAAKEKTGDGSDNESLTGNMTAEGRERISTWVSVSATAGEAALGALTALRL